MSNKNLRRVAIGVLTLVALSLSLAASAEPASKLDGSCRIATPIAVHSHFGEVPGQQNDLRRVGTVDHAALIEMKAKLSPEAVSELVLPLKTTDPRADKPGIKVDPRMSQVRVEAPATFTERRSAPARGELSRRVNR